MKLVSFLLCVFICRQLHDKYGVVTSFTGTYKADEWSLVLQGKASPIFPSCGWLVPSLPPSWHSARLSYIYSQFLRHFSHAGMKLRRLQKHLIENKENFLSKAKCGNKDLNSNNFTLRWLKTVSSTFQDIDFDRSLLPLFISWCFNHGIKKLPNHWSTHCYQFYDTMTHYCLLKTPLILALTSDNWRTSSVTPFLLWQGLLKLL